MQADEKMLIVTCASCGHILEGRFCSQCGEKVLRVEDKGLRHFFEEFFHGLTHADSKFLKSIKYLFTKPGFLTSEYLNGRRKLYASPLNLFFVANLVYLLIGPVDALNSHYVSQIRGQFYSGMITKQATGKMEHKKWTMAQMEEHYNSESGKVSKLLLIVFVFLFSLPVSMVFYTRDGYYSDHLVFATEFANFIILVVLTLLPYLLAIPLLLYVSLSKHRLHLNMNSDFTFVVLALILFSYLLIAAKRVYRTNWLIPKTLLLLVSTVAVVTLYRFILFQVTISLL
jgi:hypothetical protein